VSARPPADLVQAQLRAVDAWNAARAAAEQAEVAASREGRMDLARRRDVLAEQHRAIVERVDLQLRDGAPLGRATVRAVVAHRNAWFTDKVAAALQEHGLDVVARVTNGAQAVGVVVVEQPDLLLVEDALPMLTGLEVVREVRRYAPDTVLGAHVAYAERVGELLDAGAHGAWARHVPPVDVAQGLAGLLTRELQPA
jgi:CheY-like chemotaxis protein